MALSTLWQKKSDDGKTTKPPSHLDVLLAANFLASAELMSPVGLAKLAHCSGLPCLCSMPIQYGAKVSSCKPTFITQALSLSKYVVAQRLDPSDWFFCLHEQLIFIVNL